MRSLIIYFLTAFSLIQAQLPAGPQQVKINKSDYPVLAFRFQDSLKKHHPSVENCEILFTEGLTITIEFDRQKLYDYLAKRHQIKKVYPSDADRYLANFRQVIRQTAAEIFTEIPPQSIQVNTRFTP